VAPSGTPLLTAEGIRRLKAAGVEAISLSLDGADAARHDGFRGVRGCFDRTLAAARECAAAGLPFQINTLVSEETLDELPAIHRLAADLGALRWSLKASGPSPAVREAGRSSDTFLRHRP